MRRNRKRKLILFTLLMSVLTPAAFFLFSTSFKIDNNVLGVDTARTDSVISQIKAGNILQNSGKACAVSSTISYLYYPEVPENKIKNNKFGLYIYAEEPQFFELARKMVNSNGGEWGYVLIPYNVKDRDAKKWARVFEDLREKKLIPIVQLYDVDVDKYESQTQGAATFLNKFIWPIKNRYISVYNEPNDSKFWKGKVDPAEYAVILGHTVDTFKKENNDYFMLNGAFNTSASTTASSTDAFVFMHLMNEEIPGIFNKLDGWASHSYPQPNFSGDPMSKGRWSIRAYEDELEFLEKEMGVKKDLPVFITETGWAHAEGERYNPTFLPVDKVAENMKKAYEKVWLKDDRVWAVTPFTIWYNPPFDHFSWVNRDNVPYKHYEVLKSVKKVKGTPAKLEEGTIVTFGCST